MKALTRYVLVQLVVVTLTITVVMVRAADLSQMQLTKPALGVALS